MTVAVAEEKEQESAVVSTEPIRAVPRAIMRAPGAPGSNGRQRRVVPSTNRVRRDGKFFRLGGEKFFVKGVTYGPFAPNADGDLYPSPNQTRRDFEQILQLGGNCVRVYHTPPPWFFGVVFGQVALCGWLLPGP